MQLRATGSPSHPRMTKERLRASRPVGTERAVRSHRLDAVVCHSRPSAADRIRTRLALPTARAGLTAAGLLRVCSSSLCWKLLPVRRKCTPAHAQHSCHQRTLRVFGDRNRTGLTGLDCIHMSCRPRWSIFTVAIAAVVCLDSCALAPAAEVDGMGDLRSRPLHLSSLSPVMPVIDYPVEDHRL